ncbi:hypothetical protein D3C78_1756150 [compost metagenome]
MGILIDEAETKDNNYFCQEAENKRKGNHNDQFGGQYLFSMDRIHEQDGNRLVLEFIDDQL